VQASTQWAPPSGVLGELVTRAQARAAALPSRRAELERAVADAPPPPPFGRALARPTVAVIAEVKRRSPSKGEINPGLSAVDQSLAYARGGAAALSILTEPDRFGGAPEDVPAVRAAVAIPVLKKDFHVHPLQMLEARALGASAALVIARAVPPETVLAMVRAAHEAGIDALVEIRDERELEVAVESGAAVIGVNNRNLETLHIDLATGDRLVPQIPADRIAVFESGISTRADVERAAAAGADAVLVGSSISAAGDPTSAVGGLATVTRVGRARTAFSR
jgi:indole-3-glycerol phosphate synthase